MIVQRQALSVVILSVATGLFLSPAVDHQESIQSLADKISQPEKKSEDQHGNEKKSSKLQYGTAHDHAQFYLIINGTRKDLTAKRYQLQSDYVHLENNNSNIVHKHAKGVNWSYFFNTINMSVERENKTNICVSLYNSSWCGNGTAVLNGETANFSEEISQGDNLLIVLESENRSAIIEKYMKKQLPPLYKPSNRRGRRI